MKKITSFTHLKTGEGNRIAYTYSEVSPEGDLESQNNKGNFIVVDAELEKHIAAIQDYISEHKL